MKLTFTLSSVIKGNDMFDSSSFPLNPGLQSLFEKKQILPPITYNFPDYLKLKFAAVSEIGKYLLFGSSLVLLFLPLGAYTAFQFYQYKKVKPSKNELNPIEKKTYQLTAERLQVPIASSNKKVEISLTLAGTIVNSVYGNTYLKLDEKECERLVAEYEKVTKVNVGRPCLSQRAFILLSTSKNPSSTEEGALSQSHEILNSPSLNNLSRYILKFEVKEFFRVQDLTSNETLHFLRFKAKPFKQLRASLGIANSHLSNPALSPYVLEGVKSPIEFQMLLNHHN